LAAACFADFDSVPGPGFLTQLNSRSVTGNKKPLASLTGVGCLVAWDGIEPSTRGFSKHMAAKTLMFMGIAA